MARTETAVIQIQKQPSRPTIKSSEAKRFLKKKREAEVIMIHIVLMLITSTQTPWFPGTFMVTNTVLAPSKNC